ncbi:MAG: c-type cytochrome biogenesis protein CcmI [Alphaproteobacteria bacterium]
MTWMIAMALAGGLVALLCIALVRPATATSGAAHDLEIYRDQMAELDREVAAGLIGAAEAEAARAEVARRMIGAARGLSPSASRPAATGAPDRIPLAALAACIVVPLLALGIYADRGRPGMPAVPAGSASSPASQAQMIRGMVDGLAARLAADPGDVQGWRRLARSRRVLGEIDAAREAASRAAALAPDDLEVLGELAELHAPAGPADPLSEAFLNTLRRILARRPDDVQALFFLGLDGARRGDAAAARGHWERLLAVLPPGAPVAAEIKREVDAIPPGR